MSTARETQASISVWAEEAFGPVTSSARVAARVNEEMSELLRYLASDDRHPKAAEEVADVAIVLARLADRLGVVLTAMTNDDGARAAKLPTSCIAALANERLAQLVLALTLGENDRGGHLNAVGRFLRDIARCLGTDLQTEVDRKMAVNRARTWRRDGTGHGYHVPKVDAAAVASEARHTEGCHKRWGARRECSCADDAPPGMRRGRCAPGDSCLACDRLGYHLEPSAVDGRVKCECRDPSNAHVSTCPEATRQGVLFPARDAPYWRKLPVELRADVLETHYLTAKECLEQTSRERDQWKKGCQEWQDEGLKARARVTELEAERAAPAQDSAREELSFIVSYLAHNDQDANHAWMVRRIRAVLAGKDPGAVEPWSEHDGVRRPRRGEPVQGSRAERHQRTLALIVESAIDYLQEMGECPFCALGESGEDLGTEAAKHEADCPLAGYELTVDIEALIVHAKQCERMAIKEVT